VPWPCGGAGRLDLGATAAKGASASRKRVLARGRNAVDVGFRGRNAGRSAGEKAEHPARWRLVEELQPGEESAESKAASPSANLICRRRNPLVVGRRFGGMNSGEEEYVVPEVGGFDRSWPELGKRDRS